MRGKVGSEGAKGLDLGVEQRHDAGIEACTGW